MCTKELSQNKFLSICILDNMDNGGGEQFKKWKPFLSDCHSCLAFMLSKEQNKYLKGLLLAVGESFTQVDRERAGKSCCVG